jgi:hypothetical protein
MGLHAAVLVPPAEIRQLSHLDDEAEKSRRRSCPGDQLLGGLKLADEVLRCVPGAFHGRVTGPEFAWLRTRFTLDRLIWSRLRQAGCDGNILTAQGCNV